VLVGMLAWAWNRRVLAHEQILLVARHATDGEQGLGQDRGVVI
jgi:hypothetical protein